MSNFQALYSSIIIREKKMRNRIVLSPMGTRSNLIDGTLTDRCSIYLEERAKGGAALIIPEFTAVKEGYTWIPSLQIYSDKIIPSLSRLAESIHAYGSHIIMQLALHGGTAPSWITKKRCIAPSAIMTPLYKEIPDALTESEIIELVRDWRDAAIRTKRSSFDGVEVHGCHGYLINQFISPVTNKRTDYFGGSLKKRLNFAKFIVEAIREACGEDFIIGFKMSAYEDLEGGVQGKEAVEIAKLLERIGVDYLHVSSLSAISDSIIDCKYTEYPPVPCTYNIKNCLVPLAEMIKKSVSIPVIATGGIIEPEDAEQIINQGRADMVAIGRAFLADAYWGLKALTGENIKPCIGCMTCHKHTLAGTDLICSVNPGLLREFRDLTMPVTKNPQNVMIIGGGPAGMETAIQAFDQGHRVTIYEKNSQLGGQLRAASIPYFKYKVKLLLSYYFKEINLRGISINYNVRIDQNNLDDFFKRENYDVVVIAVGGVPLIPDSKWLRNKKVYWAEDVILSPDKYNLGNNIVIIGAGKVGMEAAWMFAEMGKHVNIVEALKMEDILRDDHPTVRSTLLHNLEISNVKITANCLVEKIEEKEMSIFIRDNKHCTIPFDSILLATGYQNNSSLCSEIRGFPYIKKVFEIGDGKKVRGLAEAIREGYFTGRYII